MALAKAMRACGRGRLAVGPSTDLGAGALKCLRHGTQKGEARTAGCDRLSIACISLDPLANRCVGRTFGEPKRLVKESKSHAWRRKKLLLPNADPRR